MRGGRPIDDLPCQNSAAYYLDAIFGTHDRQDTVSTNVEVHYDPFVISRTMNSER